MFEQMIAKLRSSPKRLVFTEGADPRILKAAIRLRAEGLISPILLGGRSDILAVAKEHGWSVDGITVVDPMNFDRFDAMLDLMVMLRNSKMDEPSCRAALAKPNYFGTMLVKMGLAGGLLGGATYSTADTVRPALQLIKTKPGNKIVSSCFILYRAAAGKEEIYVMADCAINLSPTEDELVEIATETAKTARIFSVEPRVALLSYSTLGSGKGETVEKVRNAADRLKGMALDFPVEGELQFDAAFSPEVAKTKAPGSYVSGKANTFIFPDINAGNIGYKIAQRLGGFEAYGPILQGLNAPVNDLSRGCNAEEVYKMAIITAATQ